MGKKYQFKHLETVRETYFQHFCAAIGIVFRLLWAALTITIHAIFPPFFEYTGSRILQQVLDEIKERQNKHSKKSRK